jgi:hypothetical protein
MIFSGIRYMNRFQILKQPDNFTPCHDPVPPSPIPPREISKEEILGNLLRTPEGRQRLAASMTFSEIQERRYNLIERAENTAAQEIRDYDSRGYEILSGLTNPQSYRQDWAS